MFVELHMLQNFAPSNLNRDDTNSPKDCEFGGYRRARISSQSIKRAMRTEFNDAGLVAPDNLATRTKRLREELIRRFQKAGHDEETSTIAAETTITSTGLKFDRERVKTQYLLFLGESEIEQFVAFALENWDDLASGKALTGRKKNELLAILNGGKACDLALFGRMIADLPRQNIDAASQVAHAISTNRVSVEFDFYTAVDDLRPEDTEGADMLGTIEFNSACFYRYANVDLSQLMKNLAGDEELARATLEAFVRASVRAIPTGKQNSMAAHNPPSLVFAVLRDGGRWSLANAFLQPVAPRGEQDLMTRSIRALDGYWARLAGMYGESDITGTWAATLDGDGLDTLTPARVPNVDALVEGVLGAARFNWSQG